MNDIPFLDSDRSDQYFLNTLEVLKAEGRNPAVVMEVFPNADGLLCGIREVLDILRRALPDDARVWALDDGVAMARGEVVLRLRADYRAIGAFETALLGTLAHGSGWATAARACVAAAGEIPVISFGARHVHPAVSDRMEYAAGIGGCAGCATPAGAALRGQKASGTMPHALMLIYGDTVAAARAFNAHMPNSVPRIVLVDTFRDEAEESVRVARAMAGHLWGVRLDTPSELGGVTPELVWRVRGALDRAGFDEVGIFVSGGLTPDRISEFVRLTCPIAGFGVGSAISGASPIDFTADLKEVNGKPIAKRGRKAGIQDNPRLKKNTGETTQISRCLPPNRSKTVTIKVLFFASCRDLMGASEQKMTLTNGATVADLISTLASKHARFTDLAPSLMVSVNQAYVHRDVALREGDEVAFIPPVSGG